MSFQLLSWPTALIGCGVLAAILFLIQRLRVQHREVEVQTTLFWQAALEETRARVFVKRFRHWKPWLLLVAIASLLWLLFAGPQQTSSDGVQHVVLLDWSIDDEQVRVTDVQSAMELAERLPANAREVVAVGTQLETLLRPNEDVNLIELRSADVGSGQSTGMDWAIEKLSSRATDEQRVAIYVVGDSVIDANRLPASDANKPRWSVVRVPREKSMKRSVALKTLGVSESKSGAWDRVDLWLDIVGDGDERPVSDRIAISTNGEPLDQQLVVVEDGPFEIQELATNGSVLDVDVDGQRLGSITLPNRSRIRISFDGDVPEVVRELVQLDPACEIVTSDADVVIGSSEAADFQFVSTAANASPAFAITTNATDNVDTAINSIVDELALRQVDATSLAEQSGETIQVDVAAGDRRRVAMWQSLFSSAFDFRESRACPIVVSRTIRWLANTPPIVEWAAVGERLPVASSMMRASVGSVEVLDGQTVATSRLLNEPTAAATLSNESIGGVSLGFSPFTLLGVLVVVLLSIEWVLYQRGQMP